MIKNIIFDIGGVIAYFDENEVVSTYSGDKKVQKFLKENVIYSPEWVKCGLIDLGYISLENMGHIICDRTDHIYDEFVMDLSVNHINFIDVKDNVLDLIKRLKNNGYKVYLLSNTNEKAMAKHNEKHLEELVDGAVLSYQVHSVKPHLGIYKELLNKYNLNPIESIFIDDRKANIDTANKLGIIGVKVKSNSYEDVIDSLKKYNVNVD